MANLILKYFLSRDINSLVRAFTTYVRPRLEYCSVVWNLVLQKDIGNLEKVQRKFTKRLARLQLENLELRRQLFDLLFTYLSLNILIGCTINSLDNKIH